MDRRIAAETLATHLFSTEEAVDNLSLIHI